LLGQRTEQKIDRRSPAARLVEMQRLDLVINYLQSAVRRNDIDVVGLQSLTLTDLHNGHPGARRDNARHFALMRRIKMHDDDKGCAGAHRQRAEEVLQRLNTAGRCADENNHRFGVAVAACCNVVAMVGHARILRLADWIR
jgi:hypothetical protein